MLRPTCVFIINISVLLLSCSRSPDVVVEKRSEGDSIYFRKWHYKDGSRKKVEAYNVRNKDYRVSLLYYPDGTLRDSSQLFDGKYHGHRYEFRQNGNLRTLSLYDNGNERSRIDFSPNGSPEGYKAWNYEQNSGFVIEYDSSRIASYSGNAIYSCFTNDTIRHGKKAEVEFWVALPPDCMPGVVIGESNKAMKKLLSKTVVVPDNMGTVRYTLKRKADEVMYRMHVLTLKDTVRNKTFTDTLYLHVSKDGSTHYSWKQ